MSESMPKVSIIVPSFNHAAYLHDRIDSILCQSFQDFEIILLDDASTDRSVDILKQYRTHPKVTRFAVNAENSGSAFRQWERGVGYAAGDYIWIAESDDVAAPDFLASLTGILDANPSLGIVYSQSLKIDASGSVIGSWRDLTLDAANGLWGANFLCPGREMVRQFLIHANVIPNASAVVIRKRFLPPDSLKEASSFTINGDWYVWSSILLGSDVAFFNHELNACRFHAQKGSVGNIRNFNNIAELYRLRGFMFRALDIPSSVRERLNSELFSLWMKQRARFGVSIDATETRRVQQEAEKVDPLVRKRLAREAK